MTWSEEHGRDRLYDKFTVTRVRTGKEVDDQFVFVLCPETDAAACVALKAYAEAVRYRAPNLAKQIEDRVNAIRRGNA